MGESTRRSSALTRLGRAVEHAAAVLFAWSDARARASGWEVRTAGRWSTSRVYHDPRYDRLAACPSCAGHGCPCCFGTGRSTAAGRPAPDALDPAQLGDDPRCAGVDPRRGWIEPDRTWVAGQAWSRR